MEGLLIALAIAYFLLPIIAISMSVSANNRLKRLESYLAEQGEIPDTKTKTPWNAVPSANTGIAKTKSAAQALPYTPGAFDKFFSWLRENWLLAVGALFILFAIGWLARYAFLNSWIGPVGRITMGVTFGVIAIAIGQWRIRTHLHQGSIFLVLGSTAVLLTVFAGREMYDLFTPLTALGTVFLTAAFVAFCSVRYRAEHLSYAGIVMACLAPVLASSGSGNFVALFSYLAVVCLATVWVVSITGWRKNILWALLIVSLYSLPYLERPARIGDPDIGMMFAFGFTGLFFFTNLIGKLRETSEGIPGLMTAGMTGLFIIGWITQVGAEEWQSLMLALWMLVFASGSFALFKKTKDPRGFYVYSGVSLILLLAATAVEFSGPTLTLALTLEAGILPVLAFYLFKDMQLAVRSSLIMILPVFLSMDSLSPYVWRGDGIFHQHFFVLLLLALVPLGLIYFFFKQGVFKEGKASKYYIALVYWVVAASFYGYSLLWRVLHAGMDNQDTATMLSLVVYTLIGLFSYIKGHALQIRPARLYGGVLLAWVIFRLVFIDMPDMQISGRIITFFFMGALLLGTAFIEYRGRQKPGKKG